LSAFFSASETSFSTVNIIRLKNAKDEGKRGAKKALFVAEHFDKTLSAILIGNNVVNMTSSSLATVVAIEQIKRIVNNEVTAESWGPIIATIVITVVVLLFGEILPKSIAKEYALAYCLNLGWILLFFIRLFTPLSFVIMKIRKLVSGIFEKGSASTPSVTEDELEVIIETMEEEGVLEEEEREMIRSVLDLSDTIVYDIMTPRVDMTGVYIDDNIDYVKDLFLKEKYSRVPVYRDTKDNVVGILYERDFFSNLIAKKTEDIIVEDLMKKPVFVPKSMRVDKLIEVLQRNKQHMAIVSDEYGGTSGLVTMEDCLEELVGEIYDEHDEEEYEIKKVDDNNFEINASVYLEDLFEELELGKAPDTHYNSVSGWLYEKLEEIPIVGDKYVYTSLMKVENDISTIEDDVYYELVLTFTVKELQNRRMKTIGLNIEKRDLSGNKEKIKEKDKETKEENVEVKEVAKTDDEVSNEIETK
jgi:CBS domain containing-hemolysin-like protein